MAKITLNLLEKFKQATLYGWLVSGAEGGLFPAVGGAAEADV
jgi:hypothetical protein